MKRTNQPVAAQSTLVEPRKGVRADRVYCMETVSGPAEQHGSAPDVDTAHLPGRELLGCENPDVAIFGHESRPFIRPRARPVSSIYRNRE